MSGKAFAVLYRWTVDPAFESEFRARWRAATVELRDRHGALGSCLSRDSEGAFVAFARWPARSIGSAPSGSGVPLSPGPVS
jgi:hypothetical protein